jgi:hypothetical protein
MIYRYRHGDMTDGILGGEGCLFLGFPQAIPRRNSQHRPFRFLAVEWLFFQAI